MPKKLAIFGLSLLILPVQTYAQTQKAQEGSTSQKPAAPTSPVLVQKEGSPQLQPEHKEHVDADVRIISAPEKDGYDHAAFWINVALASIGFLGIGIGVGTLWFIRAQVNWMKTQAVQMALQLEQMEEQNAVARISAEYALLKALVQIASSPFGYSVILRSLVLV
jgi:hypothetical protein